MDYYRRMKLQDLNSRKYYGGFYKNGGPILTPRADKAYIFEDLQHLLNMIPKITSFPGCKKWIIKIHFEN